MRRRCLKTFVDARGADAVSGYRSFFEMDDKGWSGDLDAQLNLVDEALNAGFDWPFCQLCAFGAWHLPA